MSLLMKEEDAYPADAEDGYGWEKSETACGSRWLIFCQASSVPGDQPPATPACRGSASK